MIHQIYMFFVNVLIKEIKVINWSNCTFPKMSPRMLSCHESYQNYSDLRHLLEQVQKHTHEITSIPITTMALAIRRKTLKGSRVVPGTYWVPYMTGGGHLCLLERHSGFT